MNITLIQADLVWNDPAANRNRFEREIFAVGETDLVVLPEMFPTGFCTRPREAAEPDGGPSSWHGCDGRPGRKEPRWPAA